jgi:hypothetical protein
MDRKKQQVAPLRYAPVGMTKGRAAAVVRSRPVGWTERNSRSLETER